jgi:serine/threonine protein kinase
MKLCDFGLVSVRSTTAGTPQYMAPELLENKPFNKSVDVYAFGILLWEIFTQSIPFYMLSMEDLRSKVLNGERPEIPCYGCPMRCGDLIARCW